MVEVFFDASMIKVGRPRGRRNPDEPEFKSDRTDYVT